MIRSIVIMLCLWVPLLGAAEWGARAWVAAHGDALAATRAVLQVDPILGWKQRAGLDTTFMNQPLRTNEWGWREQARPFDGEGLHVLVLGPSSAFGWGVAEGDTYARKLEASLSEGWHVINAGEIGYSVVQGRKLFSKIRAGDNRPDVIVIAYGVNDLDYHRFYYDSGRTDMEEFAKPHPALSAYVTNVLLSSSLVDLAFKAMGSVVSRMVPDGEENRVRVPPEDFRAELSALVTESTSHGARVILLTTSTFTPANASPEARAEMERIAQGVAAYNDIMRSVGEETGAVVVDLDTAFAGSVREDLFVDPVHFSAQGNELVARAIAPILSSYGSGKE